MPEIIVNGSFETGDLTDWTVVNNHYIYLHDDWQHSGKYSCVLTQSGEINQTFNVKVSDIVSFGFWWFFNVSFIVTFSDQTTFSHLNDLPSVYEWTYFDLKTWIQQNKSPNLYVTKITFLAYGFSTWIDDVTLTAISHVKGRYCEKCGKEERTLFRIQNQDFCHYEFLCLRCYNEVTMNGKYISL